MAKVQHIIREQHLLQEVWQVIADDYILFRKLKENLRGTGITTNVGISVLLNTSTLVQHLDIESHLKSSDTSHSSTQNRTWALFFKALGHIQKTIQTLGRSFHRKNTSENFNVDNRRHQSKSSFQPRSSLYDSKRRKFNALAQLVGKGPSYSQSCSISQPVRRRSSASQDSIFMSPDDNLHDIKFKTSKELEPPQHIFKEALVCGAAILFSNRGLSSNENQQIKSISMVPRNQIPQESEEAATDKEAERGMSLWTEETANYLYEETLLNNGRRGCIHSEENTLIELQSIENERENFMDRS
jgi:hypothetical protein